MGEGVRRELLLRLQAAERRVGRLESRQGLGTSQYLAGVPYVGPVYFFDGTFVERARSGDTLYTDPENTGYWHGEAGVNYDDLDEYPGREVYLRLNSPFLIPAGRRATIVIFANEAEVKCHYATGYQAAVYIGLITAAFSQSILEAMTWSNKLAPVDETREIIRLEGTNPQTIGSHHFWKSPDPGGTPNDANAGGAHAIRVGGNSPILLTGIRLRWSYDESPDPTPGANFDVYSAWAWILNTKTGKTHRSFAILE